MNRFIISTAVLLFAFASGLKAQSDTTYVVFCDNEATINLTKKASQTLYLVFHNGDNDHLHGVITSENQQANVRFTQIFMPDSSADGPFSREIDYDLPQKGRYTLLLGENMMAGDPWEGKFTVKLTLSKKR